MATKKELEELVEKLEAENAELKESSVVEPKTKAKAPLTFGEKLAKNRGLLKKTGK